MYVTPWELKIAEDTLETINPLGNFILSDFQAYSEYRDFQKWYDLTYLMDNKWSNLVGVSGNVRILAKNRILDKEPPYSVDLNTKVIQQEVEGRHLFITWCVNPRKQATETYQPYSVFQKIDLGSEIRYEAIPTIDSWEVYDLADRVRREILKEGYMGKFITFEFKGPYLLSVGFAPILQLINIDGNLVKYGLRGGEDIPESHEAYSCMFFVDQNVKLLYFDLIPEIPPEIVSFHVCCAYGKKLSDYPQIERNRYQYLLINGVNLKAIHEFKAQVDAQSFWKSL